jgi:serine protease
MPERHRSHRRILPFLLAAALAGCDALAPELPTGARPGVDGAGIAPLLLAGPDSLSGRYVVVLHEARAGMASPAALEVASAHGGRVHHTYRGVLNGFAASLEPSAVEALRRDPRVKYVVQDAISRPSQGVQDSPPFGLDRIDQRNYPGNHRYAYSHSGQGVRVYVIDSGIRTTHNNFDGRASVGTDLVGDGQNGQDCNGHGTHVAGTIGGHTYGVAKSVQLVSVRVFPCAGGTPTSTVIAALDWVRLNAVKPAVANYSGGSPHNLALNQAAQALVASGVTLVTSAGNESVDACTRSPASTPEAITVGAADTQDGRPDFSNWGGCVDVFAPGTSITSAWFTDNAAVNTLDGTSMAAPHVAGVAALYLQANPAATPAAVAAQIVATSSVGRINNAGAGSPNRIVYSRLTVEAPGARIALNTDRLDFTFVRPVAGSATSAALVEGPPQAFTAVSGGPAKAMVQAPAGAEAAMTTDGTLSLPLLLSNPGVAPLNWVMRNGWPYATVDPQEGQLSAGHAAQLTVTVNAASLAPGTHGTLMAVSDSLANNNPVQVGVNVNVLEPLLLQLGTPRTGIWGSSGHQAFYAVQVSAGASSLRIATNGTGDADLYVRYGTVPTTTRHDCASTGATSTESCEVLVPAAGTYYVMLRGAARYDNVSLAATLGGPPATPLNPVTSIASVSAIRLTWTDASVNEGGFHVQRRQHTYPGLWTNWVDVGGSGPNAVSFTSTGLTAGSTSYDFRVRACNPAGCSGWAASGPVIIPTAPPSPPFDLVATPTSATAASLTWTDGSGNETAFHLARGVRNLDGSWAPYATIATLGANTTSFSSTGLLPGRQYRYQVTACNVRGCAAWATSNVLTTPTPPGVPRAISGTVLSPTSIRVQWTDGSAAETSFQLERTPVGAGGAEGGWVPVAAVPAAAGVYGEVQYTHTGLGVGTYRYRVRACNLAGCSAWIKTGDLVIPPVPGTPLAFWGTTLSPTSIRLTWTDIGPETSFQLQRAMENPDNSWTAYASVATLGANLRAYDDTGLPSNRVYRYRLRACNLSGCSAWAESNTPRTTTP